MLPNYKAIGQRQAFHSLKVKKLDVCVRPFFVGLVEYYSECNGFVSSYVVKSSNLPGCRMFTTHLL